MASVGSCLCCVFEASDGTSVGLVRDSVDGSGLGLISMAKENYRRS